MEEKFRALKEHLAQVCDLRMAAAVLSWDRETYMPPGGGEARARQLATLSRLAHETFVADEVGEWLEALAPYEAGLDFDSDDASLLRVARRDYDKERRVPASLVAEMAQAASLGQGAWEAAREAADFSLFEPHLVKLLALRIQWANCFDHDESIYDPMLDDFEPGLTTAQVRTIFDQVRAPVIELVSAIGERQDRVDASCLQGHFDPGAQWDFGIELLKRMSFDFDRGRQDRSAHPFTTNFSHADVRITTRLDPEDLTSGLFGTIHEGGHALYEMGVSPALDRTILGGGASMVLHESQSRLFENLVGRGLPFWRFAYPRLQAAFPHFRDVELETFYRAINHVQPSLIRVYADEVTYGLHIILRFELELALVTGELAVADLPAAWNAKMEAYLGLTPPDDAAGVLQDVHWSAGYLGYFPAYFLGSMLSVQIFEKAQDEMPDLPSEIEAGRLANLVAWLGEKVHRHGRKFTLSEIMERVLGAPFSSDPYLRYLWERYGEIYHI